MLDFVAINMFYQFDVEPVVSDPCVENCCSCFLCETCQHTVFCTSVIRCMPCVIILHFLVLMDSWSVTSLLTRNCSVQNYHHRSWRWWCFLWIVCQSGFLCFCAILLGMFCQFCSGVFRICLLLLLFTRCYFFCLHFKLTCLISSVFSVFQMFHPSSSFANSGELFCWSLAFSNMPNLFFIHMCCLVWNDLRSLNCLCLKLLCLLMLPCMPCRTTQVHISQISIMWITDCHIKHAPCLLSTGPAFNP